MAADPVFSRGFRPFRGSNAPPVAVHQTARLQERPPQPDRWPAVFRSPRRACEPAANRCKRPMFEGENRDARGFLNVRTIGTDWSLATTRPTFATGVSFAVEGRGVGIECRKLLSSPGPALSCESYSELRSTLKPRLSAHFGMHDCGVWQRPLEPRYPFSSIIEWPTTR